MSTKPVFAFPHLQMYILVGYQNTCLCSYVCVVFVCLYMYLCVLCVCLCVCVHAYVSVYKTIISLNNLMDI